LTADLSLDTFAYIANGNSGVVVAGGSGFLLKRG
jgi:hypothetical protein